MDLFGSGSVLPIPATFILGSDGVVQWPCVDVDYRSRAEPEEFVIVLENLESI